MSYESAMAYDVVQAGRGKDYAAEAAELTTLIRSLVPAAASLLDLGCGSGGHLVHFAASFPDVAGVDASPAMLDVAAAKAPGASLVLADMADFSLGRRFDAIVCLFSSLGYLRDVNELRSCAASVAAHLTAHGVMLAEPWFTTEQFGAGRLSVDSGQQEQRTAARITRSSVENGRAVMVMDYLLADTTGTEHIVERHEMTLFSYEDYLYAFRAAGFHVRLDLDAGPAGRGLITARPAR